MSSPRRHGSWLKGMNISELNWPGGTQEGRHSCWTKQDTIFQEVFLPVDSTYAVKLLLRRVTVVVPLHYISGAVATATQLVEDIPSMSELCPTEPEPEPCGLQAPGPSRALTSPPGTSPSLVSSIPDIPLSGTPLVGHPFPYLSTTSSQEKWDHCPTGSPDFPQAKRTQVFSPKVEAGSEHSSTLGYNHMPYLTPETRTGFGQQRQESSSPSSSPIGGLANPDDEAVTGSSKSTGDQTSLDSGLSRGNLADSYLDTASDNCLSCSNTDEVSIRSAHKKYRKRVRASYKLSKGIDWTDTQMKRIEDSCQEVWGHDCKSLGPSRNVL